MYGLLRSLAVRQEYKGQGIENALIQHILTPAFSMYIDKIFLLITSVKDYFTTFGFLESTEMPYLQKS
jgi:N-acetylglutamate synthase-like GNAT family acetyltransferase